MPLRRIESGGPSDYLSSMKAAAPLALALVAALAVAGCQNTEDAAFGAKVRSYLLANPEVLEEMAAKLQEKQQLKLSPKVTRLSFGVPMAHSLVGAAPR